MAPDAAPFLRRPLPVGTTVLAGAPVAAARVITDAWLTRPAGALV
ncbi:MAG: hypothetical protein QOJ83_2491 [Frankiales bacterium]|nr:hypothetical protein [Frankiales bacterium]